MFEPNVPLTPMGMNQGTKLNTCMKTYAETSTAAQQWSRHLLHKPPIPASRGC